MTRNQCRVQTSNLIPCPCGSSLMRKSSLNAEFPQALRPDGLLFSSSIRIRKSSKPNPAEASP